MVGRKVGALLLVLVTGCAGAHRGVVADTDPYEAELEAIRYELRVLTAGAVRSEPVEVSAKDIPTRDPVGDQLQAAAIEVARRWHPREMSRGEKIAIENARAKGEHWKANLLEREARGRYVHREVADQFKHLRWNHKGIDAVDPKTGYKYELLTRTDSNMGRHGRRMAEELFRMIGF